MKTLIERKTHPLDITRTVSQEVKPKMPSHPIPFQRGYGYELATVLEWSWSVTFGRWGATVRFEDGREVHSYPKHNPIAAPFYEPDGSKHSLGWLYARHPRFPQERTLQCPVCSSLEISMVGGAMIRGFQHPGWMRCQSCGHFTPES